MASQCAHINITCVIYTFFQTVGSVAENINIIRHIKIHCSAHCSDTLSAQDMIYL